MDATISIPAVALFLTALGMTLTLITSIAIVVWRFSALSVKMEALTAKMDEVISDIRASRQHAEAINTRMVVAELKIESLSSEINDLSNRLAQLENMR